MHNRKSRTYPLAICAMLSAIILLLAFTPLGLIDLPLIKATILHVPVIIGAVLLGWRKGALLGGVFGLASLVKNTIAPSALSFAFSPFIPVPGTDRGSIWALVICLIPRILTGITPALVYAGVRRCFVSGVSTKPDWLVLTSKSLRGYPLRCPLRSLPLSSYHVHWSCLKLNVQSLDRI